MVEDTFDWYAEDDDGNLWYFGEDTTEFEDGEPAGHAGAWEAGVDGALPGILLPADPEVGMTYRQEHYAGEAEDRAKVLSLDEAEINVPFGDFTGALRTEDTTPLEPDVVEHKFYVRDVGPVLALKVRATRAREELVAFTADSRRAGVAEADVREPGEPARARPGCGAEQPQQHRQQDEPDQRRVEQDRDAEDHAHLQLRRRGGERR